MEHDVLRAGEQLLPEQDWNLVRNGVPILCVDALLSPSEDPRRMALVRRAMYSAGDGWCLIGGRVLRNEHLPAAVERHVAATLGPAVRAIAPCSDSGP
jgi:ADP-ribose pyrophosphatase YjhB (NUDIX family)